MEPHLVRERFLAEPELEPKRRDSMPEGLRQRGVAAGYTGHPSMVDTRSTVVDRLLVRRLRARWCGPRIGRMITLGIDVHKRTHTVVAVDSIGREIGSKTTDATATADHLALLRWARGLAGGHEREWAVEDCRALSRRLESDLLGAGERIKRVPAKLMAQERAAGRPRGKSDPIDAVAVARAALRYPDLPIARLDGPSRALRLLVDHREDLVEERTRCINRLRWHLHEIDPDWNPTPWTMTRCRGLDSLAAELRMREGLVVRIALDIAEHAYVLTEKAQALEREIGKLVQAVAPSVLALPGLGPLSSAKIVAEVADVRRFRNKDAFARHNGTAPLPIWSGNEERHRLARTGNRQLNAALHRMAITQARHHAPAREYLERRAANGSTKRQARRALKRHLSDVVFRALMTDAGRGPERSG